jgi:hypothetical protein
VKGLAQLVTQVPLWQNGVAPEHARPHAPQFAGSLPSSLQTRLHSDVADEHVHLPARQACPLGHATAHAPQLALSLEVSTHFALHSVRPTAHGGWQLPFEHARFASHLCPHDPQFAASPSRSTHNAPHADCPLEQVGGGGGTQSPALQV